MKKILYSLYTLLGIFTLTGCTNDAEVEVPIEEKKLAVVCFISPSENQIKCVVSHSMPIFGKNEFDYPFVENAEVVISNGEIEATLNYDSNCQCYNTTQEFMPLVPGRTYFLRATSQEFGTATAKTTIPALSAVAQEASVTLETRTTSFGTENIYRSRLTWEDVSASEFNYYRVTSFLTEDVPNSMLLQEIGTELVNDGLKEDGKLVSRIEYSTSQELTNPSVLFYLTTCNKDYYEFHRTAFAQGFNGPFTEPVIMYDNVENGFGCFGAFNNTTFTAPVTP